MSGIPAPILFAVTIVTTAVTNLARGAFAKDREMTARRLWLFNLWQNIACLVTVVAVEWLSGEFFGFSWFSVLLGLAFAVCNVVSVLTYVKAQTVGPFVYTAVISSLSALIPALSGAAFFGETITLMQIIGIVLMVLCIVLSPDTSATNAKKANTIWLILCLINFVTTGAFGVFQKIHQGNAAHKAEMPALLITCFLVSTAFSAVRFVLADRQEIKIGRKEPVTGTERWIAVVAGVTLCFPHILNLFLAGRFDAVVLFPLVNIVPMLLSMLYAVAVFGERLSARRWIGVVLGIVSTVFVGGIVDVIIAKFV